MSKENSILVHICCASCGSFVFSELQKKGLVVKGFFYNPSVDDPIEYRKRLKDVTGFCKSKNIPLISEQFDNEEFKNSVEPFKDKKSIKHINDTDRYRRKRCYLCFDLIIEKTVEKAKQLGLSHFTSTLLCSPYKDHNLVIDLSNDKALDYNLKFCYQDFRKGYWNGRNYGKNHRFYIPSFCGCKESLLEKRLE